MDKKTEGELAYSDCADGKARGEGKEKFLARRPHREQGVAALRRPFRKAIMTKLNFEIKGHFIPKLGACVDTRF